MKLPEALFREHWLAYQVSEESIADRDRFEDWDVQPLRGPTLAEEDVEGAFEGLFIVAAQIVSSATAPQPCYVDVTLPERIAEHHFLQVEGRIIRRRGRRVKDGTVIPSIGIEKHGLYTLFLAKENPSAGISVLRNGISEARQTEYLAYDLAYLLRDQKMYEEAIEAFSVVLAESQAAEILLAAYKERFRLYSAIGHRDKAEADRQMYTSAFQKKYGHPPGPHEL